MWAHLGNKCFHIILKKSFLSSLYIFLKNTTSHNQPPHFFPTELLVICLCLLHLLSLSCFLTSTMGHWKKNYCLRSTGNKVQWGQELRNTLACRVLWARILKPFLWVLRKIISGIDFSMLFAWLSFTSLCPYTAQHTPRHLIVILSQNPFCTDVLFPSAQYCNNSMLDFMSSTQMHMELRLLRIQNLIHQQQKNILKL